MRLPNCTFLVILPLLAVANGLLVAANLMAGEPIKMLHALFNGFMMVGLFVRHLEIRQELRASAKELLLDRPIPR